MEIFKAWFKGGHTNMYAHIEVKTPLEWADPLQSEVLFMHSLLFYIMGTHNIIALGKTS
jgi:hypothetical protein